MEEGLRCSGLSGVIGELWGDPAALDFTATRRLAVAAERSRVPCWLVRLGGTANLSGARMRWRIASMPEHRQSIRSARSRVLRPGRRSCSAPAAIRPAAGASRMRRMLSIWLPHLAVERWARSSDFAPDDPVVLTVEGTHGPIIHAVTRAAAERGACAGARLTDARALDPSLIAVPADPAGDAGLGQRLARWAGRWSPLVEVDGADALRLDVTGVAHLFGGERELVDGRAGRGSPWPGLTDPRGDRADGGSGLGAGALRQCPGDHLRQGHRREARRPAGRRSAACRRKRRGPWSGSASRPSARWRGSSGARSPAASARRTIRSMRSTGRLAASPSR